MTWIDEVQDLHSFFERWYRGSEQSLDRLESVLADGFTIVGPSGEEMRRAEILAALQHAQGTRPDLSITTTTHRMLLESEAVVVAAYVEVHDSAKSSNRRQSTVVFQPASAAPHGLEWLRVHETWLAEE